MALKKQFFYKTKNKIIWIHKRFQISKAFLSQKNKAASIKQFNVKTHHEDTVTKTYWNRTSCKVQGSRTAI